jgi:predicted metal-dependent HD superfamily phosphohydrolase/ribosomal protein S18 acetylase RimI-like enzyme
MQSVKLSTEDRWTRLWQQVSAASDSGPIYQELLAAYAQPHRHYHNLQHIDDCLSQFDSARNLAKEPIALELAIWFHDAIYDTHAQDNEERSAELARRRIADAGASTTLGQSVAALVLATKAHDPALHPDAPLLVDVDLSILGQPPARFWTYETQIRREYEWVPEPLFAAKRAEILERFLARKRIYSTDLFLSKYETQARLNLQNSIRSLKTPLTSRPATLEDCPLLAELNHQLIRDEGHRNPMTVPQLEQRMRGFIEGEYRAVLFAQQGEVVAYALYREGHEEIYLRQLFVLPYRRRQGIGRRAVEILRTEIWPKTKRLTVEVLVANHSGVAFWRAIGYVDYALTLEIMP